MKKLLKEREYEPWLALAMAAPLAEAASRCSWLTVLVFGSVCTLLCMGVSGIRSPGWMRIIQWLTIVYVTAGFLDWTHDCWRGELSEYAVPAMILILASISAARGEEKAARAANVLRYGVFLVFAAVIISGASQMQGNNLRIGCETGAEKLTMVLLIPAIGAEETGSKKYRWIIPASAVTIALVTGGVMGRKADFYQLSRSISILGAAERLESLTAAAMTISYFALLSFLLVKAGNAWQDRGGKRRTGIVLAGLSAYGVYVASDAGQMLPTVLVTMVVYVIIPLLAELKNKCKKEEKRC